MEWDYLRPVQFLDHLTVIKRIVYETNLSHMIRPFLETSGQGGDLGSRVALEAGSGDVIRQSTELLAHVATKLHALVTSG